MAKLAKTTVFEITKAEKETPLDKTSRIVRRMKEDEAERLHVKTARLRKARFERENKAGSPASKLNEAT